MYGTFQWWIESTLIGCPTVQTEWELFGIPFPVIHSFGIDPLGMKIGWHNGCNSQSSSLWLLLGGVMSLFLGAVLTVRELLSEVQTVI